MFVRSADLDGEPGAWDRNDNREKEQGPQAELKPPSEQYGDEKPKQHDEREGRHGRDGDQHRQALLGPDSEPLRPFADKQETVNQQ